MTPFTKWVLAVMALAAGCTPLPVYKSKGETPVKVSDTFYGQASFYGQEFQGKPTANGERFDMYKLTAAHRTLPFGTKLRVTNLSNGQRVVVRINDRGPFVHGRVIDLSFAAARELAMLESGTTKVKMEVIEVAPKK